MSRRRNPDPGSVGEPGFYSTVIREGRFRVLAHPGGEHFREIQRTVGIANQLQDYFFCELTDGSSLFGKKTEVVDADEIAKRIQDAFPGEPVIAVTEAHYESGLVLEEYLPNQILVSVAEWDDDGAPSIPTLLLYSLASSLITFEARLDKASNQRMCHKPAVGCLFDWWIGSDALSVVMVCARMCHRCEHTLKQRHDVHPRAVAATNHLLEYVRKKVLGLNPQVPTKVFVAHGWSEDWKELRAMLDEFGVEIAEFNEATPVGRTIPDRWKEMLDQSRFAFALLTPDEEIAPGIRVPRPNVIHEIGLCQARLGLERAVILREQSVPLFSNLTGVVDIPFVSGRLREQTAIIRTLLERHGLLRTTSADRRLQGTES